MKQHRQQLFEKYNGRCAYCGCELKKGWHVDHIEPKFRNHCAERVESWGRKKGEDTIDNYNPSCPRCNRWKSTYTIEQFRREIASQIDRLKRDSSNFRMALDFGIIKESQNEVIFYFEKHK